jgi:hypothetical protein
VLPRKHLLVELTHARTGDAPRRRSIGAALDFMLEVLVVCAKVWAAHMYLSNMI